MNGKPLMFDFFCGLGGATEGFLAEGWECVGIDNERHDYGQGGYPGHLILQDIMTFHGSQAKDAAFLWFSPPCQAFSWMAMPWSLAKKKAVEIRDDYWKWYELTKLFVRCFEIQLEASWAAGHHIPLIVENVRGAQPWVGPAKAEYGSFMLWGDIGMAGGNIIAGNRKELLRCPVKRVAIDATKNTGGSWFNIAHNTQSGVGQNPDGRKTVWHANKRDGYDHTRHLTNQHESELARLVTIAPDGTKVSKSGRAWYAEGLGRVSSKSNSRKAASAQIAKIPFVLARHIARCFKP